MENRPLREVPPKSAELPPPTPHGILLLGVIFCILGGALIVASVSLSWVIEVSDFPTQGHMVADWYMTDLTSIGDAYYLMYLIPVFGIVMIAFSVLLLVTEKGPHHTIWAMGSIITAIVPVIVTGMVLFWLTEDFMNVGGDSMVFGPAPYICVFGCVLGIAGGFIQLMNSFSHHERRRFAPRPTSFRSTRSWESREQKEEQIRDSRCPGCNSPVSSTWKMCPLCGHPL